MTSGSDPVPFVQKTRIANKLTGAIVAIAVLFLLQLFGISFSGMKLLSELTYLHESQQLVILVGQLGQITENLTDIPEKMVQKSLTPADSIRIYSSIHEEVLRKLQQVRTLARLDPRYNTSVDQIDEALKQAGLSARRFFAARTALATQRELLIGKQYSMEALEAEQKLQFAIDAHSNALFAVIYHQRYHPLEIAIALTLLFMALAVWTGLTLTGRLTDSITRLVNATREIARGNLDLDAPILGHDEIGVLADAFNGMTRALRSSTVSRKYLETLIESLPEPLFVLTPQGFVERTNRVVPELLGYENDELAGKPLEFFSGPEPPIAGIDSRSLSLGGIVKDRRTTLRTRSGKLVPAALSAAPVLEDGHHVTGIVCVVKDLTIQSQAESERARAEESKQLLAESTAILFESIDYATTVRQIGKAIIPRIGACTLVRIQGREKSPETLEVSPADPTLGKSLLDIHEWESACAKAILGGETQLIPETSPVSELREKLGIFSYTACPLRYQEKVLGALLIFNTYPGRRYDRQDLILHEELSRRACIALENARLYQQAQDAILSRDEFLSIASHELKTPLTSLSLQLQVFSRGLKKSLATSDRDRGSGAATEISIPVRTAMIATSCEAQSRKLAALLDELLDLTRIRLGKLQLVKESVDLGSVVRDVLGRFSVDADQNQVTLHFGCSTKVVGVWDPMRLEQIVTNLVSNAFKYGNGKPIQVTVDQDETRQVAQLTVQDHGMGIAPEMREKIFERFERAGVSGKRIAGLGLGLYICKQIVQAHGGTVHVESELGVGSTFVVELPLNAQDAAGLDWPMA